MPAKRDLAYRISVTGQTDAIRHLRSFLEHAQKLSVEEQKAEFAALAGMLGARKEYSTKKKKVRTEEEQHAEKSLRNQVRLAIQAGKDELAAARLVAAQKLAIEKHRIQGLKDIWADEKKAKTAADNANNKNARDAEIRRRSQERTANRERIADEKRQAADNLKWNNQVEAGKIRSAREWRAKSEKDARIAQEAKDTRAKLIRDSDERSHKLHLRNKARELKDSERAAFRGRSETGQAALTIGGYAGRGLVRGAHAIASGTGMDQAFDLSGTIRERLEVGQTLAHLAVEARKPGEKFHGEDGFTGGLDTKAAMNKFYDVSTKTGYSPEQLSQALNIYGEKGLPEEGMEHLEETAMQARAMGTEPAVMAKLRAQMSLMMETSGELNKYKTPGERQSAKMALVDEKMGVLHLLGKTGTLRAKDFAKNSEELLAGMIRGGGNFSENFDAFGRFAESARLATGSAPRASTGIRAVEDAVMKPTSAKKIHALGIRTVDDNNENRFFLDVVKDVIQATGGDKAKLSEIFTAGRGMPVLTDLVQRFRSAGGGKEGRQVMDDLLGGKGPGAVELNRGMLAQNLAKDAAYSLDTPLAQFSKAAQSIKKDLAESLEPALTALAKHMPAIISILKFSAEPITKRFGAAGRGFIDAVNGAQESDQSVTEMATGFVQWAASGFAGAEDAFPLADHSGGVIDRTLRDLNVAKQFPGYFSADEQTKARMRWQVRTSRPGIDGGPRVPNDGESSNAYDDYVVAHPDYAAKTGGPERRFGGFTSPDGGFDFSKYPGLGPVANGAVPSMGPTQTITAEINENARALGKSVDSIITNLNRLTAKLESAGGKRSPNQSALKISSDISDGQ